MKSLRITLAFTALLALVTQSVAFASDCFVCAKTGREMVGCAHAASSAGGTSTSLDRNCCCELRKGYPLAAPVATRDELVQLQLSGIHAAELAEDPRDHRRSTGCEQVPVTEPRPPDCPRYLSLRQLLI